MQTLGLALEKNQKARLFLRAKIYNLVGSCIQKFLATDSITHSSNNSDQIQFFVRHLGAKFDPEPGKKHFERLHIKIVSKNMLMLANLRTCLPELQECLKQGLEQENHNFEISIHLATT